MDHVVADHAVDVTRMKTAVEDMWRTTSSKRDRRKVSSEGAPGVSLFGDNIGEDLTLCQGSLRAGYNYQPIRIRIQKVWTNQKPENLVLSLSKSDRLASFL